jgi:hypothetical protein
MKDAKGGVGQHRASERAGTAYHEAGHAVVAIALGRSFRKVTIVPDEDSLGHVLHRPFPKGFRPDIDVGSRNEHRIRQSVMCSLAGMAAERRGCGRATGYSEDLRRADDMMSYLSARPTVERLWCRLLLAQTEATLEQWWPGVEALCAALLARRTILGSHARAIVLNAMAGTHGGDGMANGSNVLAREDHPRRVRAPENMAQRLFQRAIHRALERDPRASNRRLQQIGREALQAEADRLEQRARMLRGVRFKGPRRRTRVRNP